ncbi:unnamed protein product [Tenebrio molitor]|nr:unnamed protein product [Tenebrio molitor]
MCDYEEQVVQCPYNKFHMCLLSRLTKHMWKCHPTQYKRDRDIRLNKKCADNNNNNNNNNSISSNSDSNNKLILRRSLGTTTHIPHIPPRKKPMGTRVQR